MKPLKLAHTDGTSVVCYDSSGSFILTGGEDGNVCIWEGKDDTDTTTVKIGEKVFAIAFQGDRFFAATDENAIRVHTFPDGVSDGMVTRFTAPCRALCVSEDGCMLVAGANDFKIKVISLEEKDCICLYGEHEAPVLSVALDPTREFVASASCDGTVKVWNIFDGTTEKSLGILPKYSEPGQAKSFCQMCWSSDGEFLLVPVKNEIQVYLRSSWEVVRNIRNADLTEVINVMSMSPDGLFLATGFVNGDIGIFEWQDNKLIDKHTHPKHLTITSIAWNPKNGEEIAFCDNLGQLGFVETGRGNKPPLSNGHASSNGVDDMDDMDDDILASAIEGQGNLETNGNGATVDEINRILDGDDENSIDIGQIKRSLEPVDEDAASISSSRFDETPKPPPVAALPVDIFKPTPLQKPFQPSSTPEHLSSRFMVWNSVGIVRQYISDDENSIDVEFHDTATHHALHIENQSDFAMADLSTQAVLLASRGEEDLSSKLLCMHFGSWDNHREWTYEMPSGEEIQAITVTEQWVAVATISRTVRIFTIGGLQSQILSLPGSIVALASHHDKLLVVYHKGMGIPGDQYLGVSVLKVRGRCKRILLNGETLPLSPASRLSWIGFSEEGNPFFMDTDGVIRTVNKAFGSTWCQVANTRQHVKGKSDNYWLVAISERHQQIRCIPCKGSRFPATLPRPALAVLPFQIPLCDMESEKAKLEESLQRSSLFSASLKNLDDLSDEDRNKPIHESLIKLFALSAKAERDFRALEVCDQIEEQNLLHMAATYATRLKRIALAERVSELMHRRNQEASEEVESEEEAEEETQHVDDDDDDMVCNLRSEVDVEKDHSDDEKDVKTPIVQEARQSHKGPMLVNKEEKQSRYVDRPTGRVKNPFKSLSSSGQKLVKGSQVFDKMEKTTPKLSPILAPLPVSIKKSGKKTSSAGQSKLLGFKKEDSTPKSTKVVKQELAPQDTEEKSENLPLKTKMSAFDLWFEAKKADLQEEHADLSEEDLVQKATEAFRALDKEERASWVQKAKSAKVSESSDNPKKRKLSSDKVDDDKMMNLEEKKSKSVAKNEKKAPLSQSTNAKLAKFAKVD